MVQSLDVLNDKLNIWDLIFKKKSKYLIHKLEEIHNLKKHIGDWIYEVDYLIYDIDQDKILKEKEDNIDWTQIWFIVISVRCLLPY